MENTTPETLTLKGGPLNGQTRPVPEDRFIEEGGAKYGPWDGFSPAILWLPVPK